MLLILLAFSALAEPSPANAAYGEGMAALKLKNAEVAVRELSRCVALDPQRNDCLWELGWAHWLSGDWAEVVDAWSRVEAQSPSHHPKLPEHLATARSQLSVQAEIDRLKKMAPPTVTAGGDGVLRIRAVGDVMLGTVFPAGYLPPEDGAHLLDAVAPLLQDADLAFANLEGPLCDSGVSTKCGASGNCYAFRSPTHYGQYIRDAGVDLVSTANNHARDFGQACRDETHATLDSLGIAWSGPAGTTTTLESNGVRVGMVAFHTDPGSNHLNNTEAAAELVAALATAHPVVIVSFHGGAEGNKAIHVPHGKETFYGEDRGNLREFTHAMIDAGADLVLGHGPHVPRAMEIYKGRLIAYSLGNFATYGRFNLSGHLGHGMVLEVELTGDGGFAGGKILSTKQVGRGIPEPDGEARAADLVRLLSQQDFPQTHVQVGQDGSLAAQ